VFVTCYKAWTDTVLKTDIKMIDVSCMVLVYKIANEKVANMYYLKKQSWQPVPVRYRARETIFVLIESYKEGKWKNACAAIAFLSNTC
jgi:hypothetical protein